MTMTSVNVFPDSTGKITVNATTFRGVTLDRMDVVGPKGGKSVMWRAAAKREYQMASWSHTREDAAK